MPDDVGIAACLLPVAGAGDSSPSSSFQAHVSCGGGVVAYVPHNLLALGSGLVTDTCGLMPGDACWSRTCLIRRISSHSEAIGQQANESLSRQAASYAQTHDDDARLSRRNDADVIGKSSGHTSTGSLLDELARSVAEASTNDDDNDDDDDTRRVLAIDATTTNDNKCVMTTVSKRNVHVYIDERGERRLIADVRLPPDATTPVDVHVCAFGKAGVRVATLTNTALFVSEVHPSDKKTPPVARAAAAETQGVYVAATWLGTDASKLAVALNTFELHVLNVSRQGRIGELRVTFERAALVPPPTPSTTARPRRIAVADASRLFVTFDAPVLISPAARAEELDGLASLAAESRFPKDLVVLRRAGSHAADASRDCAAAHVTAVQIAASTSATHACSLPPAMRVPDLLAACVIGGRAAAVVASTRHSATVGGSPAIVIVALDRAGKSLQRLASVACPAMAAPLLSTESPSCWLQARALRSESHSHFSASAALTASHVVGLRVCSRSKTNTLVIATAVQDSTTSDERDDAKQPSIFHAPRSSLHSARRRHMHGVHVEAMNLYESGESAGDDDDDDDDVRNVSDASSSSWATDATRSLFASAGIALHRDHAAYVVSGAALLAALAGASAAWWAYSTSVDKARRRRRL
ncbi:hypothetical protein PPROV_000384600 [Pycnococcus provasolii]|uniref:Uncharacterized protein n=1 Tax=Pycnococcus provasolii TaxID=41880 RepID=A0A830HDE7_9CHLO|nr:hypothetical protein PPROV_000384600 [Pycnococcus provasolii]